MGKLLCVVDTQIDFVMADGNLPVPNAEEIIAPGIKFLANLDPNEYNEVLFTFDTHIPNVYKDSEEGKLFPMHCNYMDKGWQNVFGPQFVHENIEQFHLYKDVFDMWNPPHNYNIVEYNNEYIISQREDFFNSLWDEGLREITVFGVALNVCVKHSVLGFIERGFKVELKENLCRGIDLGNGKYDLEANFVFEKEINSGQLVLI